MRRRGHRRRAIARGALGRMDCCTPPRHCGLREPERVRRDMPMRDGLVACLLSALLLARAGVTVAATAPEVRAIRLDGDGDRTRMTVDLDRPVAVRAFTLADPSRLVLDLPEVEWRDRGEPTGSPGGIVARVRHGLFAPGRSRLVLDMAAPFEVVRRALRP